MAPKDKKGLLDPRRLANHLARGAVAKGESHKAKAIVQKFMQPPLAIADVTTGGGLIDQMHGSPADGWAAETSSTLPVWNAETGEIDKMPLPFRKQPFMRNQVVQESQKYKEFAKGRQTQAVAGGGIMMGKVRRNPFTGEIIVKHHHWFPNFHILDVANRKELPSNRAALEEDPYLYRAVPMLYRSWIYQGLFSLGDVSISGKAHDSHGILKMALGFRCLDVPVASNRWSPAVFYVLISILSAIPGDTALFWVSMILTLFTIGVSNRYNLPLHYSVDRKISLPFRIAYTAFPLIRIQWADWAIFKIVAAVLCTILAIADLILGDAIIIRAFRFNASYEIQKALGNRVYVCKRIGGEQAKQFGFSIGVDPSVSGLETWTSEHIMIADIEGMIMELRPMRIKDWIQAEAALEQQQGHGSELIPLVFTGLDLVEHPGGEGEEHKTMLPKNNNLGGLAGWQDVMKQHAKEQAGGDARGDLLAGKGANPFIWQVQDL
mmetsp:Transcript_6278/g.11771  ORF Transcript_6278/g.11771 Transcript_6278/m.11771 type:complete len:492 (-) Transcript_6278:69-1544(-)